jgi:hypothetical protein
MFDRHTTNQAEKDVSGRDILFCHVAQFGGVVFVQEDEIAKKPDQM